MIEFSVSTLSIYVCMKVFFCTIILRYVEVQYWYTTFF